MNGPPNPGPPIIRPAASRAVPPVRAVDHSGANERFVRKILAWVAANSEHRTDGKSYGEVAVKLSWADGKITQARLMEETILKPDA